MTENIFDRCLGVILSATGKQQKTILSNVDKQWFNSKFHRDVLNAITEISNDGTHVDILNLTQWLRDNDKLGKDYVYRIAGLQNEVGMVDLMNVNGVLNECYYVYSVRQISLVIQNVNTELMTHAPSSQKILKELNRGQEILTLDASGQRESNKTTIESVLDKHEKAKMGISIGLELGWKNLKQYIVLENDDVMVVGGRPAMGKTAWAISLIKNVVFDQSKPMIFFSLEMSKDRIIRRLIALMLDIDSNKIKFGHCNAVEISRINELKEDPIWSKLHILDGSHSVKDIQREVLKINGYEDIELIVIDYLQKILPEKNDNRYQEVTKISNNVKRLVMSQRIPCIALAQLNRDSARSGKRPSLPDLKESGEIEQDASIVAFLHRPEYYGETMDENGNSMEGIGEFITAKNRDGQIGIVEMQVDLPTSRWSDYIRQDHVNPQIEEF